MRRVGCLAVTFLGCWVAAAGDAGAQPVRDWVQILGSSTMPRSPSW